MKLSAKTLSGVLHGLNRNSCDWYVFVSAAQPTPLADHRHGVSGASVTDTSAVAVLSVLLFSSLK